MNRWNSLTQMIEHSMKHATCTCSFVNIPNIDIHKIKNGLVQFKRIEVSTNHNKVYGNRRKYTCGNNFEKENIDFKISFVRAMSEGRALSCIIITIFLSV